MKMELQRIKSFQVDHTKLDRGMYISRIDGDIITYDIRMKKPNSETVLENAALHTIEHIFATYVRSGESSGNIVYFGPMGCRTGFYLITRGLPDADAIRLTREAYGFIAGFDGEIPGAKLEECGNYLEHDLTGARAEAAAFLKVMEKVTEKSLVYVD
jgi:S-ribosylhomocysteine lyase